jgi:hypothetical protein
MSAATTITIKLTPREFETLRSALESAAQTYKDLGEELQSRKEYAQARDAREGEARIRFLLEKVF